MKEIKRDNATINYRIFGGGETTLMFVHGSYIDQTYWNEQVKYFLPRFTIVTLDLPGHGLSGRERAQWSTEGFSEDIITVIKELDLKNVILIGHSWGADVNLIAAAKRPDLILGFIAIDYYKNAATLVFPPAEIDAVKAQLKQDFAGTNENYCRMVLLTPETPAELTTRVVGDFRSAYEPMGQAVMPEIFEMYKVQQEYLPQLRRKLYIINVYYQPTDEKPLKQYCKQGYAVRLMKGTSHFPMLENPEELNKLLAEVVDEINSTR